MADRKWYRSLYWRIAIGFVALVSAIITAQALVTLWLAGRVADLIPGRTPGALAAVLATSVSEALAADAELDLEVFLRERHGSAQQAFAVVMRNDVVVLSENVGPPEGITGAARSELLSDEIGRTGRASTTNARTSGGGGLAGRSDRAGPGLPGVSPPSYAFARVVVRNETVGIVAVPSALPPLSEALRGFGPTLAAVGGILLALGTALAALLVFRPAHRRLRSLEDAARALGNGHASARASEAGGDEVASLARTFNEMAGDLHVRAVALAEADRTRRQLLADISHELATPLAAIRGYAETLGMPDVELDSSTRRRYLQVITDETERLGHLVGDLLDLARLEGGGLPFTVEDVSVAALFERVVQRHEPLLRTKQVTMSTSIAADVTSVHADQSRLEQALQNLVANAVRHCPEGGTVRLRATRDSGTLIIVVEDSGFGIPEQDLARVFDRFYKVDESRTGTATPSGSGLGLSIVRAVVERHGGIVAASNRPEGGARFEMRLPIEAADHPTSQSV
jgi:signal transduction histidine kinase